MLYGTPERLRLLARDTVYFSRYIRRRLIDNNAKPIYLCNSYPKSGTHLLSQILMGIHNIKYWDDIVSVQSLSGVMNSEFHIRWKIGSAPSGSLVRSHLTCDPIILKILEERPNKRIFMYRDLRDVAVSHANWVMKEPRIFLHNIYKNNLKDFDDRLSATILGTPLGSPFSSNVSQPTISQDFERWYGWLTEPSTLAIRFEDLVGSRGGGDENIRIKTIGMITKHIGANISLEEIENRFSSITLDPNQSHTFRKGNKGAIGGWREKFNSRHKDEFKRVAGDMLIKLGYEQNNDW